MKQNRVSFVNSILILLVLCVLSVARAQADDSQRTAKKILEGSGVKGGLIVPIGCGDGGLTSLLRANDSYVVHGLDTSADNVARARKDIRYKTLACDYYMR